MENYLLLILLYLTTLASVSLAKDSRALFIGLLSIAAILAVIDLPDIPEYKIHYEIAQTSGNEIFNSIYNFEIGYNALVFLVSTILPFEIFYIILLATILLSYHIFYKTSGDKNSWFYLLIFLSIALYFVSFTIRTSIASIFIVLSLILLKNDRWLMSIFLIGVGALFHTAALPFLIFPVVSVIRKFINDFWLLFCLFGCLGSFLSIAFFQVIELLTLVQFFETKVLAYDAEPEAGFNFFMLLWCALFLFHLINPQHLSRFDQNLLIGLFFVFIIFVQNAFFLGRLMWLTSFLFVYFLTKIFLRCKLSKDFLILLMFFIPMVTLIRF